MRNYGRRPKQKKPKYFRHVILNGIRILVEEFGAQRKDAYGSFGTCGGGIHREWTGVPRKLFNPGTKTSRCACVKNFGPPLSSYADVDEEGTRGDLDNPNLHEYPGCSPTSNSCKLQES
uniref:Uncharacterized protein n=1 Tax=Ascaris lumbricoides TaxID=6252 RepID=A0A0M3I6Y2_ASCLU